MSFKNVLIIHNINVIEKNDQKFLIFAKNSKNISKLWIKSLIYKFNTYVKYLNTLKFK
jgi:hypothetical protein